MDIDKILRQYKIMSICSPILKFIEILVLWIILPFTLLIILGHSVSEIFSFIFLGYVLYLIFSFFSLFDPEIESFKELLVVKPYLTNLYFSNYVKKWGISEEEVLNHLRRKQYTEEIKRLLSNTSLKYTTPIIHRLYLMNKEAKEVQMHFLLESFSEDSTITLFETNYSDSQVNEAILYWRKRDLDKKKIFINYLYKFVILEDGIHRDEWDFLITLMYQLKFSKALVQHIANRYAALLTEFEERNYENGRSTTTNSNIKLKEYYSILGVEENSTYDEIKKAYHTLALTHHPDLPKNAIRIKECEELMAKINEAYNMIVK